MMQDLIHRVRPTLIIETGIAHGGSVLFHASLLQMLHATGSGSYTRPHVIAIDIDIRPHNRQALDQHALRSMLTLLEASSIAGETVERVGEAIRPNEVILVVLDSNHTRDHVLAELNAYGPMVTPGSAIVVMDGIMSQLAELPNGEATWRQDHPGSAIEAFLQTPLGQTFTVDRTYESYALTHSPGGVLFRNRE